MSQGRGLTLIEAIATMAILALGVAATGMTVSATSRVNRHNLIQAQAMVIAERELERVTQLGCDGVIPLDPCANLKAFDQRAMPPVFWSANGVVQAANGVTDQRLRFDVALDVDPPFEAGETGNPSLARALAAGVAGNVVNVRVTVSWDEDGRPKQALALETRVAP